jgi:hypothetical protein
VATTFEYAGNMHMHTPYSDGAGSYATIARAAQHAGLDFVIVTDHNVLVRGVEGFYGDDEHGHVLLLTGEEIHDQARLPQVNHLLVYGAETELAQCAFDPQTLIDSVNRQGGMCFLAHPYDQPLDQLKEPPIPWVDWQVNGFTGLEIWNYMSGLKEHINMREATRMLFRPEEVVIGPRAETMAKWDSLLAQGMRVVGIGNADAHGTTYRLGPLAHTIFPYDFLFACVNTHILSAQALVGNLERDKGTIYRALRAGNAFIGYDLLGSTRGFRFSANGQTIMGGNIRIGTGVTLQTIAPARSHIRLIRHGEVVAETRNVENLTYTARQGGAYRVEVWREFKGRERAWILSNPIYIEDGNYTVR